MTSARAGEGPVDGHWDIEVEHPFDADRTLFTSRLADAAIVTSTSRFRRWVHRGRWQHHLIDPATGEPADRGVAAVVVTDADAWRAEGMAKAALVAGPERGRRCSTDSTSRAGSCTTIRR